MRRLSILLKFAAIYGKTEQDILYAYLDVDDMEFETLKNFGFRVTKDNGRLVFNYRGKVTRVLAIPSEIRKYLLETMRDQIGVVKKPPENL